MSLSDAPTLGDAEHGQERPAKTAEKTLGGMKSLSMGNLKKTVGKLDVNYVAPPKNKTFLKVARFFVETKMSIQEKWSDLSGNSRKVAQQVRKNEMENLKHDVELQAKGQKVQEDWEKKKAEQENNNDNEPQIRENKPRDRFNELKGKQVEGMFLVGLNEARNKILKPVGDRAPRLNNENNVNRPPVSQTLSDNEMDTVANDLRRATTEIGGEKAGPVRDGSDGGVPKNNDITEEETNNLLNILRQVDSEGVLRDEEITETEEGEYYTDQFEPTPEDNSSTVENSPSLENSMPQETISEGSTEVQNDLRIDPEKQDIEENETHYVKIGDHDENTQKMTPTMINELHSILSTALNTNDPKPQVASREQVDQLLEHIANSNGDSDQKNI